jgi:hypothetical protein
MRFAARLEGEAMAHRVMGTPLRMEPAEALQFCIDVTRGEIAYCDARLAEMGHEDATIRVTSERRHQELDKGGDVHELHEQTSQSDALLHVWITTRQAAVDRLARYSKWSLDCGLEERQVRLLEHQAQMIATVVLAVVGERELGLTDEQRARVPALLERHVARFDEPAIEGTVAA